MRTRTTKLSIIAILGLLVFAVTSSVCSAQEVSRSGKTELYGTVQTMGGGEATGSGITIDFDDTSVYGVGLGYNIDNNWNLNTDFLFGSSDMSVLGIDVGDADLWLWNVNLDYNVFEGPLTPLVSAGIGIFGMDAVGAKETNFSYNWGVGGRWDISDDMFLKAMYRITYHDLEGADGPDFDGVMVSFGIKF